jgi:protein-S-isoprenylcysteine O-methyltransferase Ste14
MRDLALVLLTLYGLITLLLRVIVQLVLTGSTGIRGISGRAGSPEWLAGILFTLAIALSVVGALHRGPGAGSAAAHVLGAVLAIGGLVATAGAQLAMGREWRIGVDPSERTRLVTHGPFAIVRNPIYAGMIPFFAGIALLLPRPLTIVGAVMLLVALELQTRLVEEPYLREVHGPAYADYTARVGRFLPGVGRVRR